MTSVAARQNLLSGRRIEWRFQGTRVTVQVRGASKAVRWGDAGQIKAGDRRRQFITSKTRNATLVAYNTDFFSIYNKNSRVELALFYDIGIITFLVIVAQIPTGCFARGPAGD